MFTFLHFSEIKSTFFSKINFTFLSNQVNISKNQEAPLVREGGGGLSIPLIFGLNIPLIPLVCILKRPVTSDDVIVPSARGGGGFSNTFSEGADVG